MESSDQYRRKFEIEVVRESLHFSAAHFTIFSSVSRENLHGHNFRVQAVIEAKVGEDGLVFDYSIIKDVLQNHCDALDEKLLLPENSPYLEITKSGGYVQVKFDHEVLPFLPRDVKILPVRNITVEELSEWFISQLQEDSAYKSLPIDRLSIRVASGSGQWGVSTIEHT